MEITEFRDRVPTYPGRKKLKIIKQTANEIIVDEEYADEPIEEGISIDAAKMTRFQQGIVEANEKSDAAISTATVANETANMATAKSDNAIAAANTAVTNAEQALENSTFAKEKAIEVEGKLADRGATIKVNEEPVTEISFKSDPQTQFDAITGLIAYPIGSIYMSVNETNPATIFGGIWEALQDRFLLGASSVYGAGIMGGESSHTLTATEMPSHTHTYSASAAVSGSTAISEAQMPSHTHSVVTIASGYSANCTNFSSGNARAFGGLENVGDIVSVTNSSKSGVQLINNAGGGEGHAHSISLSESTTGTAGASVAHNNMPPYLAVYMWKRVS